ncbi:MAG: hypothetical protein ACR2QM_12750 [Longimicrobiales bacterium]
MQLPERTQTGSWTAPEQPMETGEVLYFRYQAYRRRQAAKLLHVMPREAVRELYGRARSWAKEERVHDTRDPMASLQKYAETLLPLPPFEVWLADRDAFPMGHLEDYSEGPYAPPVGRPGRVDIRHFDHQGRSWTAALNVFREGDVWRGFLEFSEQQEAPTYKTANIFREDCPRATRLRFHDFEDDELSAFLVSILP